MAQPIATPGGQAGQDYRFIIVDDHPLFRGALAQVLAGSFKGASIEEAGSYEALIPMLATGMEPDIVFLDLAMPGIQGLAGLIGVPKGIRRSVRIAQIVDMGFGGPRPKAHADPQIALDIVANSRGGSKPKRRSADIGGGELGEEVERNRPGCCSPLITR